MAKEAIKTEAPSLMANHGNSFGCPALATVETNAALALPSTSYTTSDEMKPVVIEIMQQAYIGGVDQMTNGTIKKQLDRVKQSSGGWKDGDLEDVDPRPGIQPRWWQTLSVALREMRAAGDVTTDPVNYRTYTLSPRHLPQSAGEEPAAYR